MSASHHREVPNVALTPSQRSWRPELCRHVEDHVSGLRVVVLRDPHAVVDDDIDVLVVDDSSSFLHRRRIAELQAAAVHVIGVYDPTEQEGAGEWYLAELGVTDVLPSTTAPAEFVAHIRALTESATAPQGDGGAPPGAPPEGPGSGQPPSPAAASPATEVERGVAVAVGGTAGDGVTEVAAGLAAGFAARGFATLLMDLDEISPVAAARLGHELQPTVLDAIDVLNHGSGDLREALTPRRSATHAVAFDVMAGLANPDDWSQHDTANTGDLIGRARLQWERVVTVVGPRLEELPYAVGRYAASEAATGAAETAVAVAEPTPTGVLRCLDWLIDARRVRRGAPVWVVFWGEPRSAFHRGELTDSIRREVREDQLSGIVFVRRSRGLANTAWEGRPPDGITGRQLAELCEAILPTGSRRRERILVVR